ncbi:MAG: hypothetical protein QNI99_05470 [Woeseiaceae bacterium]|nr:hypothetical protein [Woeseiaceae bacterium]
MNEAAERIVEDLHWSSDGCSTITGPLLEWLDRFDAHIVELATGRGAAAYRFPSLIAAGSLAPIAYLRSFPHLATFVTTGNRGEASLKALAADAGTADRIHIDDGQFEDIGHLLTPATCYHFYPLFAGQQLDGPLMLTARCQCFRCEERYVPLERQWCFEMREVVCIGDADSAAAFAGTWSSIMAELASSLGISAGFETATDPFFDPTGDPKALAQLIEPSKEELCIPSGLAIGSVNKHRSFFGESYRIGSGSAAAHSACVAFGLERWLSAMLEVHGPDASTWPVPGDRQ